MRTLNLEIAVAFDEEGTILRPIGLAGVEHAVEEVLEARQPDLRPDVMLLIRSTFVTDLLCLAAGSWSLPSDANAGV
jgi:hypothetical protein